MACEEEVFVKEEHAEKLVGQNDLRKLRDLHFTAGVREGITAGKESALQDGFNYGYTEAFCHSHNYGKLRGVLSAMLSYVSSRHEGEKSSQENYTSKEDIEILLSMLADSEAKHIEGMKMCLKDGKFAQEDLLTRGCAGGDTVATELRTKGCIQNPDLKEFWDKCKHLCNEIGIDIQKIVKLTEPL